MSSQAILQLLVLGSSLLIDCLCFSYPQLAHLNSFCDALGLCAGSEGKGGLLDPSNPESLPTFAKLFSESAEIFDDQFVHIFDDEAHYLYNEWNESTRVHSFMANHSINTFRELETWLERQMVQLHAVQTRVAFARRGG